jgi:hypothetical protein
VLASALTTARPKERVCSALVQCSAVVLPAPPGRQHEGRHEGPQFYSNNIRQPLSPIYHTLPEGSPLLDPDTCPLLLAEAVCSQPKGNRGWMHGNATPLPPPLGCERPREHLALRPCMDLPLVLTLAHLLGAKPSGIKLLVGHPPRFELSHAQDPGSSRELRNHCRVPVSQRVTADARESCTVSVQDVVRVVISCFAFTRRFVDDLFSVLNPLLSHLLHTSQQLGPIRGIYDSELNLAPASPT